MASTNPYTSFTISQAFLGAPLEFQPPLGSPEFQELINAYVTGSASKQDKISQVTLDFYKNATVDLNTGALVRTYFVYSSPWTGYASFEQSPTQSFSSGCSPIYTPSPASSATFGDSTYGSMSMTPPNPTPGARGRVTKKAKKDTPKAAEARLPGFSIMTKDGIDVTNSAGRGTKTKEQREHAHLMRIMKACDACKKKKIRCDPSHRRSHNDMSRTASTSTQQTSSSGRLDPSPPASTPSLSRVTTHASQNLPSFSPSNPIDDFVLFPEDDSSWNSLETQDLGNFNFDINVDLNDPLFDFSFDQQPSGQSSQVGYTPAMNDQYGLGQWAEPQGFQPVSYSRPHPASSTNLSRNSSTNTSMNSSMNSSGDLNTDWQSGWLQAESLISPRTSTSAANYWAGSAENLQLPQSFIPCDLNHLDAPDWSLFESTMADGSSPDSTGDATNNELAEASQLSRNRKRRAESSQPQTPNIGPIDPSDQQGSERLRSQAVINSPTGSSADSQEISRLQNAAQLVSKSLRRIKRAPAEYIALSEELQQLEGALARLQSGQHAETLLSSSDSMTLQSVRAQLEALSPSSLEQSRFPANRRRNNLSQCMRPDHARELQMTVRRLVWSLCATTNGLAALQFTSSTLDNHLQALTRPHHERQTVASSSILQTSGSISSDGFYSMILQNTQRDLLPQAIEDKSRQLQRLAQTEQDVSSRSDSNRLASPLSSTPLPNAAYQGTSRLNVLLEEQTGGLATSQHLRMNSATTLPLDHHALGREGSEATHGIANPLPAHNSAIIFDAPPNNRDFETPQMTTVTQEPTSLVREEISSADLQTAPTSLFETQYSFAGALSILGSMALASNITSGLNISAHLPYLIPLLALSLLIPGQHRTSLLTPTLIAGSFLFTSSFTSLGLQSVRTACTEWVGNEPFSAAAKLLLVAALISSELLSSVNLSVIVVAAVNYLSGTRDACSSGTALRVSRGQTSEDVNGRGNYASWLGMMDMLSPVVTV